MPGKPSPITTLPKATLTSHCLFPNHHPSSEQGPVTTDIMPWDLGPCVPCNGGGPPWFACYPQPCQLTSKHSPAWHAHVWHSPPPCHTPTQLNSLTIPHVKKRQWGIVLPPKQFLLLYCTWTGRRAGQNLPAARYCNPLHCNTTYHPPVTVVLAAQGPPYLHPNSPLA